MVVTGTRHRYGYRTATGIAALVALILVLVFGSPAYVNWVQHNTRPETAGGLFLRTLAWPAWSFDPRMPVRDLLAADLKAILVVAFTALLVTLFAGAQLSHARGTASAWLGGWAAYVFAGALAGLLAAFLSVGAGLFTALTWALAGAGYGLLVGWIVGLAQLGARRP